MITWNYVSDSEKSNGYENEINFLKGYTRELYLSSNDDEKQIILDKVFYIYRKINIFPITYYNEDGIKREISNCINKNINWDGKVLDLKYNQGSSLCKFLFPNLFDVECKGIKFNSPYYKFYDDRKLQRAIKFCFDYKSVSHPATPSSLVDGLAMINGNVATNFNPMKAKAIYEKYCPPNGVVYDYSCGFGGRMLGCLSSKNNYTYYGVEPCSETYNNLLNLGKHIESVTGREKSFYVLKCGSEDICVKKEFADFAFSSPPYFNLEVYSSEDTQCYNKYPNLEDWFVGYVYPTINNIYKSLYSNRYYAVNIADFKCGSKNVNYVDKWITASIECGFKYIEYIPMKLQSRRGVGHASNDIKKEEGIYVFMKL